MCCHGRPVHAAARRGLPGAVGPLSGRAPRTVLPGVGHCAANVRFSRERRKGNGGNQRAPRARGNIASFVAQESLFCVAIQPLLHAQRGSLAGAGFRGIAYSSFGFAKSGIFHFLSRVFDRALPQAVALRFPYIARDGVSRWERTASWPASKN